MAHPDHREMDVARSLVDMALIPESGPNPRNQKNLRINTRLDVQARYPQHSQSTVGHQEPRVKAEHSLCNRVGSYAHQNLAHHQLYQPSNPSFHPSTSMPMPRPYRAVPLAPAPALTAVPTGGQNPLQDHLYRQQLLAGIAPENIISIPQRPQGTAEIQGTPALLQISNDGVFVPRVPPASYIPRTPYPVPPGEYEAHGNTPMEQTPRYGQFLNVPGNHQRPTFEREHPANVFGQAPNIPGIGNTFGSQRPQGFDTAGSINVNAVYHNTEYAHSDYMPPGQRYPQRPADVFNPFNTGYGSAAHNVVKSEPSAISQQYMVDNGYASNFAKNEPEEEARKYMLHHTSHASNLVQIEPADETQQPLLRPLAHNLVEFNCRTRGFHAVQGFKYEEHPAAFQPDPVKRFPISYERQRCSSVKNEDDEAIAGCERIILPVNQIPYRRPTTGIKCRHSVASQVPEISIKAEPGLDEPMFNPIDSQQDANTLPTSQEDVKPDIEAGSMTGLVPTHETTTVNGHHIFIALLDHPEIALTITKTLNVQDLIHLQTASKEARDFIIRHLPKVIRFQTLRVRTASFIFPWRCYQKLWFKRFLIDGEIVPFQLTNPNDCVFAYTASFRWLQMIISRDNTVHNIVAALHTAGYGFPLRYKAAIYKLWFLMDIPDNNRRQWTVSNRNLWTDLDIFMAIFFIVRIDMFVKIERGNKTGGQRRLIMAQPSLKFCYEVLTGQALRNDIELLAAHIRWHYNLRPGEVMEPDGAFGVPAAEIGSLQWEGYGHGHTRITKLRRPDELILREASRRELDLHEMYRRIFIFAQPGAFTACERPNSVWDQEMKLHVRGTDVVLHDVVTLD